MRGELIWVSPQRCWVRNGGEGPTTRAALGIKLVLLVHLDLSKTASMAFERQEADLRF